MRNAIHRKAVVSLVLIAGLYVAARVAGWTGSGEQLRAEPWVLVTVAAVSLWGAARLLRSRA